MYGPLYTVEILKRKNKSIEKELHNVASHTKVEISPRIRQSIEKYCFHDIKRELLSNEAWNQQHIFRNRVALVLIFFPNLKVFSMKCSVKSCRLGFNSELSSLHTKTDKIERLQRRSLLLSIKHVLMPSLLPQTLSRALHIVLMMFPS